MARNYDITGKPQNVRFAYTMLQKAAREERLGNPERAAHWRGWASASLRKGDSMDNRPIEMRRSGDRQGLRKRKGLH